MGGSRPETIKKGQKNAPSLPQRRFLPQKGSKKGKKWQKRPKSVLAAKNPKNITKSFSRRELANWGGQGPWVATHDWRDERGASWFGGRQDRVRIAFPRGLQGFGPPKKGGFAKLAPKKWQKCKKRGSGEPRPLFGRPDENPKVVGFWPLPERRFVEKPLESGRPLPERRFLPPQMALTAKGRGPPRVPGGSGGPKKAHFPTREALFTPKGGFLGGPGGGPPGGAPKMAKKGPKKAQK